MAAMIGRTRSWLVWLAGSVLALVFGSAGCDQESPPVKYGPPPAPPAGQPDLKSAASLELSKEWKQILSVWPEAEEIASGKRGDYPFDQKGQKRVLEGLAKAGKNAEALLAAGLLSAAEVGLLKKDLDELIVSVQYKRPIERRNATCYEPMHIPTGAARSFERLSSRLPLLEKLAAEGRLHRAAAEKALASIEKDLAVLSDEKNLAVLGAQRPDAQKTREAVRAQVEKLKKLLDADKAGRE